MYLKCIFLSVSKTTSRTLSWLSYITISFSIFSLIDIESVNEADQRVNNSTMQDNHQNNIIPISSMNVTSKRYLMQKLWRSRRNSRASPCRLPSMGRSEAELLWSPQMKSTQNRKANFRTTRSFLSSSATALIATTQRHNRPLN